MVDEAVRGRDAKAAELESMQAGLAALTADMQVCVYEGGESCLAH